MDKNIKDYLHLYPKVPIAICEPGVEPVSHYLEGIDWYLDKAIAERVDYPFEWIKPILRPITDLTEEEAARLGQLLFIGGIIGSPYYKEGFWHIPYGFTLSDFWAIDGKVFNQHQTIYLLSKHFDLFGLIESGLAIDKTKEEASHE
jgi:hypothetical protein